MRLDSRAEADFAAAMAAERGVKPSAPVSKFPRPAQMPTLRAFIIDNLAPIDIRKVEKVSFVDLLTTCPTCGGKQAS